MVLTMSLGMVMGSAVKAELHKIVPPLPPSPKSPATLPA